MVQVGCTINYGRSACGKKRKNSIVVKAITTKRTKEPEIFEFFVNLGVLCSQGSFPLRVKLISDSEIPRVDYPREVSENT